MPVFQRYLVWRCSIDRAKALLESGMDIKKKILNTRPDIVSREAQMSY